jgi:Tc toxin complex TcA C-terminal TcB-binding domain/Neuraminidase-like domain/Salmonella virulence plasmid 28.1kDa A protein
VSGVTSALKTIHRVHALAPDPDTLPVLLNSGVTSAHAVARSSETSFVNTFKHALGESKATQIHSHAVATTFRNDQALLHLYQTIRGAGLAAIDGDETVESRMQVFSAAAQNANVTLDLEDLFGGMDYCECDACTDVTSPANYFVELMQYLRNNTLDPELDPNGNPLFPNTSDASYNKTALNVLLKRRPDLQHLQLTCENANTLIPYLDLANEVMESFVVHLDKYPKQWSADAQSAIDVHNVTTETSNELLAEPQHTNYRAYCILREAVYPPGPLPFHQPIAAERIYLNFLKTSRYEVMDTFQSPYVSPSTGSSTSSSTNDELSKLHDEIICRAVGAEYLQIIQEEYIILTKQAFWPKRYFEVTGGAQLTDQDYQNHIGVKQPRDYWGYGTDTELLDNDSSTQLGLQFAKAQFLKRAQMQYTDLVELVKTKYVNPVYPTGKDLVIFESLRFSYRFLQTLVQGNTTDRKTKFKLLIEFLQVAQPWAEHWIQSHAVDQPPVCLPSISATEIAQFVYRWFDCLAKIVVLESGEGPTLPVRGLLVQLPQLEDTPTNPKIMAAIAHGPQTATATPATSTTTTNSSSAAATSGPVATAVTSPQTTTPKTTSPTAVASKPAPPKPTTPKPTTITARGNSHTPAAMTTSVLPSATASVDTGTSIIGTLFADGTITDFAAGSTSPTDISSQSPQGNVLGSVAIDSTAYDPSGALFMQKYKAQGRVFVVSLQTDGESERTYSTPLAYLDTNDSALRYLDRERQGIVRWNRVVDSCNIDSIRILHLDGSSLSLLEWDRINRFIRLWKRIGWSIYQTDEALSGLSIPIVLTPPSTPGDPTKPKPDDTITWADFAPENCSLCGQLSNSCHCHSPDNPCDDGGTPEDACKDVVPTEITPGLLKELVAVQKLQTELGLDLDHLLVFWTDIGTNGDQSLYARLFLIHNILGIDSVFQTDELGNFLISTTKISSHIPVILAALHLKQTGLTAILQSKNLQDGSLTLATISEIYRYVLLAQALVIDPATLILAIDVLGDPFQPPSSSETLSFVKLYQKVTNAGFTIPQLAYVLKDISDPLRPLGPQKIDILKIVNTLTNGLNAIDTDHPDIDTSTGPPTADTVTKNVVLLFDTTLTAQVSGLIEGTTVYTTNAPAGLSITVPPPLSSKLKYTDAVPNTTQGAQLAVTGILTDAEQAQAKALSSNSGWSDAIDRVGKQPLSFFKTSLSQIFPNTADAIANLLKGDVMPPPTTQPSSTAPPDPGSAPGKRAYFLKYFLPYLRQQLADQLITSTAAGAASIASVDTATLLLTSVLTVPNSSGQGSQSAMDVLRGLRSRPATSTGGWTGYLVPPTTDVYTFIGFGDTKPEPLQLDGLPVPFITQQDDPNNVWFTDAIALTGGKLYRLGANGSAAPLLQWKTARTAVSDIPSSSLLPDFSSEAVSKVFVKMAKAGIILNTLVLTTDETSYFQAHAADFDSFTLDALTLDACNRIVSYVTLKKSLPTSDSTLIELFKWATTWPAGSPPSAAVIANQLYPVTQWDVGQIQTIIGPACFNLLEASNYRNEVVLIKLQKALDVVRKVAVDIPSLFKWAHPLAKFDQSHQVAEDIRNSIRMRYSLSDWEQAAQPLHNQLREAQRDALVAYLVVQDALHQWGVVDADSLFEFFLIDVQMGACLQTSRLKQAISTVQSFVQRCVLGLESGNYPIVKSAYFDLTRYEWMQKQTLWTANRKVFLYPELYADPTLRDDKTPQYGLLESQLQQKDINMQNLQIGIKNYLFGLDQIANLLVEGIYQDDNDTNNKTLYYLAKTRSAPYQFFYRTSNGTGNLWTPWEQVQVDIPTYHVDTFTIPASGTAQPYNVEASDGSYVIPVMLGRRFLIFFGELTKKNIPNPTADPSKLTLTENTKGSDLIQYQTWEIKLGWSELRNGKWTPKQVTVDSIMEDVITGKTSPGPAPHLDMYKFVPYTNTETIGSFTGPYILIAVYNSANKYVGGFEFHGSQAFVSTAAALADLSWDMRTSFHLAVSPNSNWSTVADNKTIYSLQATGGSAIVFDPTQRPYVQYPRSSPSTSTLQVAGTGLGFYHPFSHTLLSIANATDDVDPLFTEYRAEYNVDQTDFGLSGTETVNGQTYPTFNELSKPYALYNWEVGYHAPMEIAGALLRNQSFDNALAVCQFVFNPYAGTDKTKVWRWGPFADINTKNVLEDLFNSLQPHTADDLNGPINSWRNNPYAPHVVARNRPVAYMKWTVIEYLRILIAYGDWYFRQDSLEAVPMALQYYILASHIYGPKAQRIPKRGKKQPQTYYSLLDQWDAFSNALVEIELQFPFSNQTPHPVEFLGNDVVFANIFGFATTHYFCIPDNPQLLALRDLIDDRLYKIRHCLDINGNPIHYALWDPPIDPALLVSAVAQGLSLSSFLNDLNSPMPNYRFFYLLQKAQEICGDLKSMGASFLSVKERRDSTALELLKASQDNAIQNLIAEVRNLQLVEAQKTQEALRASRSGPLFRYQYYAQLAGATAATLLETDMTYQEIALTIPKPTADGDMVLTDAEQNEANEAGLAQDQNVKISYVETTAGGLLALPIVSEKATPWGLGLGFAWGPENFGKAAQAFARAMKMVADDHTYNSTSSSRKATNIKQYQERVQQANNAGYELLNINTQIVAQQTRIDTANQEIANQTAVIANAQGTLDFLKNKYTNDDLYAFLENSVRSLFYQTYTLAYSLAKKAESAFVFERGPQSSTFIQFGYWDPSRDGLQSGERLSLDLRQLEAAYMEKRGYDFEITKTVSLRQLNPMALVHLRESGHCQFDVPEILFDMDFPGHYFRRIRSVSVTMPCIVGPYTSISATLRLVNHSFRVLPTGATNASSYAQKPADGPDGPDNRFSTSQIPIDSIAVSSAQNDSGLFEMNFTSDRYLPFEGAGAIAAWDLQLPTALKQFDYETITDVLLTIRYTSLNGGAQLQAAASGAVTAFIKSAEDLSQDSGLFALFDLQSDFATAWAQAAATPPLAVTSPPPRVINLNNITDRLPIFTRGRPAQNVLASDIAMVTATALPAGAYQLQVSESLSPVTFIDAPDDQLGTSGMKVLRSSTELGLPFSGPNVAWKLSITSQDKSLVLQRIYMVIRYTLK